MALKKIIPVFTAATILLILPTVIPAYTQSDDFEFLALGDYFDSLGYWHLVGEVQNNSDEILRFPKVTATIYDDDGRLVGIEDSYLEVEYLRPYEKAGFSLIYSEPEQVEKAESYEVTLYGDTVLQAPPASLEIELGDSYFDSLDYYHLVGEITNKGSQIATFVKVSAALYDRDGEIIDVVSTYTDPSTISPGRKAPFEIISTSPSSYEIVSASVNVESQEYSSILLVSSEQLEKIAGDYPIAIFDFAVMGSEGDNNVSSRITTGSQVLLVVSLYNTQTVAQPAFVVTEIRDSDGTTIDMSITTTTILAQDQVTISTPFMPKEKGQYSVHILAIDSFEEPELLSSVSVNTLTVG